MMTDNEIISGFRRGDSYIIRLYFYGYCEIGYYVFDQQYQLSTKENLDFMSLAHQYALYLMEHDWKPLEDHSPNVSLKTWIINGFRYVVLDALKWYKKEYGSINFEDYMCSFNMTSNLRLQFNRMVKDLCDNMHISREDKLIIDMILLKGYKGKEVAELMELTPAAVSVRFKRLKEELIFPFFRDNFNLEMDLEEVFETIPSHIDSGIRCSSIVEWSLERGGVYCKIEDRKNKKKYTPEDISELKPGEIFVFESNLKGLHTSGGARIAHQKFGAIWGKGIGLQGQSYAIPAMQGNVKQIRPYVDEFILFAKEHPGMTFFVTRIGCCTAGFVDGQISPLFSKAHNLENVTLPFGW